VNLHKAKLGVSPRTSPSCRSCFGGRRRQARRDEHRYIHDSRRNARFALNSGHIAASHHSANLLTKDEARRIAANAAKLP
jgi:hypothetical protein